MNYNGMQKGQALALLGEQPAREIDGHVFVRLPMADQRDCGGCCCRYCSRVRRKPGPGKWDTAVFHPAVDHVWTCHFPDLLGDRQPLRHEW